MAKQWRCAKPLIIDDDFSSGKLTFHRDLSPPRSRGRWLLVLIALGWVSSLLWHSAQAEESTTPGAGQLLVYSGGAHRGGEPLTQSSELDIQVSGLVAQVSLKQRFRNHSTDWVEGVYVFPLPDKAAVKRMTITIGERRIEGQIREKAAARKVYGAAKAAGQKAGLIEQQRANLFTTRIANIAPGEDIEVALEYVQTVAYQHATFSLRFPMTITPRYIPGVPLRAEPGQQAELAATDTLSMDHLLGWALDTDQVPDAAQITPFVSPGQAGEGALINPISITASLDMGMALRTVDSAYHAVQLSRQGHRYQLALSEGKVAMTQDFVLSWQPEVGREPKAALFRETLAGEDYTLLMLLPPAAAKLDKPLPREVIYVIDTSGSMDGVSIRQARQGLLAALDTLRETDRFNIIAFNSTTQTLFAKAVTASAQHLQRARRYVQALRSGGGTEMLPALQAALRDDAAEGWVRQVIFITDGAVGNEAALFAAIDQALGPSRLFTVGIGSAPNGYFMRKAAQFGRGTFTHIGEVDEVQDKMSALFRQLDSPVMRELSVEWPAAMAVQAYPAALRDLYLGEPLMLSAKTQGVAGTVTVSGNLAGRAWRQSLQMDEAAPRGGIATLWARQKISSLLDEKITGGDVETVRAEVVAVALRHQLMSPYTSFVAVEQQPSRPLSTPLRPLPVSNAQPKGQGPQHYAYPNTATRANQSLLWALSAALLAAAYAGLSGVCVKRGYRAAR